MATTNSKAEQERRKRDVHWPSGTGLIRKHKEDNDRRISRESKRGNMVLALQRTNREIVLSVWYVPIGLSSIRFDFLAVWNQFDCYPLDLYPFDLYQFDFHQINLIPMRI